MSNVTNHAFRELFVVYRGTRLIGGGTATEWPEARRETYLLRVDARHPWSMDKSVLPEAGEGACPSDPAEVMCTLVDDGSFLDVEMWRGAGTLEALPAPPGWTFMGYDVCDVTGTSGLSNCGYSPREVQDLRGRWSSALNAHHLFVMPQDASDFRSVTDARVPEHAPFAVVGIWSRTEATPR